MQENIEAVLAVFQPRRSAVVPLACAEPTILCQVARSTVAPPLLLLRVVRRCKHAELSSTRHLRDVSGVMVHIHDREHRLEKSVSLPTVPSRLVGVPSVVRLPEAGAGNERRSRGKRWKRDKEKEFPSDCCFRVSAAPGLDKPAICVEDYLICYVLLTNRKHLAWEEMAWHRGRKDTPGRFRVGCREEAGWNCWTTYANFVSIELQLHEGRRYRCLFARLFSRSNNTWGTEDHEERGALWGKG